MQSFSVRSLVEHPALRFLVVGGLGFVITMGINYGLKFFVMPQHPVTALSIGIIVATVFSYFLNKKWSFGDRGELRTGHELLLFLVVSVIGVALNSAPLWISRYVFGLEVPNVSLAGQELADFISGPVIGTLIAMGFRYWAMNRFVFPARAATLDA
ncbi:MULTISPECIES: GtrA family protein [Curtobacterium]|uniref:GtrA family protein n=1 Tax=Curtobacterium TaxID=2034 RepID=UPI000DA7F6B9|nr:MULTISPECIES: GtrA family protein [Curtobacterium]MBY0177416.1 GtrA family protein [Curtobacterium herbarum]MCP1504013.1 putative flippase GtrA [Curtobacterium herbarum]WIE61869.1 GtrA family protein [Curtobacterium sp. MCLR17_032]